MKINVDPTGTIQTESYEDYLYQITLFIQELENDPAKNPGNISNVTSSETHDIPSLFTADFTIPCIANVNSISSDFYLPVTEIEFTNGTTGDLADLNLFESLFQVVTTLGTQELSIYGSSARRIRWSINKNTELTSNNSIFTVSIELELEKIRASIDNLTMNYFKARELF